MRNNTGCSALVGAALILISTSGLSQTLERIGIEDINATSSPESPIVNADGSAVFFAHKGRVFRAKSDGTETLPATPENLAVSSFVLSSHDDSLFFLAEHEGETQLYRIPAEGSLNAEQVSQFRKGMASANLSPDQLQVAVSVSDNDRKSAQDDVKPQPIVVTRRHFKKDSGNGYIVDGDQKHLYIQALDTGETKQLTTGRYDESEPAWSPDGHSLLFVSNREEEPDIGYRTDLWTVATGSTPEAPELRRLTDSTHAKWGPSYSPDGEQIALMLAGDGPYGQWNIAVIPAEGGDPVVLTKALDRAVLSFQWSDDGEWIYLNYENAGAVGLARVSVKDKRIEPLIAGDQVIWAFDIGSDETIAAVIAGRNDASELYALRGAHKTQLTDYNGKFLGSRELGETSKVRITTDDEFEIDVFITTPPNADPDRAYPAILYLHGGPQSQFSWGYDFATQFFASQGYVVIRPNPRGSTGRGQAFIAANYRTWGVDDYRDVMAAVDYAVDAGLADPDRLAVTGYSYGGCLTNSAITRTNRFKAAASGAGESHAEASFGHNVYTNWYIWELGLPWENREAYDVHAPFLRAGHVETPTIFLGGAIDWNQPIQSSELFYQALRVRGVDSQLVVYPGVHHGGWGSDFEMDYLLRITDWFARYIDVEK